MSAPKKKGKDIQPGAVDMEVSKVAPEKSVNSFSTGKPSLRIRYILKRDKILVALMIFSLAVISFLLRTYNINWDDGTFLHPDERQIVMVSSSLGWPSNWAQFLSENSPLNPKFFAYGSFPLYLLAAIQHVSSWILGFFPQYADLQTQVFNLTSFTADGRILSALFDTGTVVMTYFVAKEITKDSRISLLASVLVTFTAFEIQVSHFYAVDTVLTFFVMLTLFMSLKLSNGGYKWAIMTGVASGLAVSTKVSAAPLILPVSISLFFCTRDRGMKEALNYLVIIGAAFIAVFIITMPYAIIDLKDFISQVQEQESLVTGKLDYPYVRQFAGTTPFIYQLKNIIIWDMGGPLGATGFLGLIWVCIKQFRKLDPGWLILLSWCVPYFLITGSFYVKFSRYMLPIMPCLSIFAAYALFSVFLKFYSNKKLRIAFAACLILVTGYSVFYSLAVDNIYSQTNTRVAASDWIYANISPGSTLTDETWDDPLPLGVNGNNGGIYTHEDLGLYEDDTQDKVQLLSMALSQANFVTISSNRLIDSIPELPYRYPMSINYYKLLFHGQLGFTLEKQFTNSPNVFGVYFNDGSGDGIDKYIHPSERALAADESFSVYDHPSVWIFKKTQNFTADEIATKLTSGISLPALSSASGSQKPLLVSPVDQQANQQMPSFAQQFPPDSFANKHPLLIWLLVVELLGILAFPLCFIAFKGLQDRGYGVAKILGLLLIGYYVWLPVSFHILPNLASTVQAAFILQVAIAAFISIMRWPQLKEFILHRWKHILFSEVLFLFAFGLFVVFRMIDPDLWHIWRGGEKPMELAFLNGILRSAYFPPYDPWFSGGVINYYYYGQYLVSILIKITAIVPTTAFNLAVPMFCGMFASGVGSVVLNISRKFRYALLGAFLVVFMGNLDGAIQFISQLQAFLLHQPIPPFQFWNSSRVIPYTINEFPFWTYLYADLHAHLIDMSVTVLGLTICIEFVEGLFITKGGVMSFQSKGESLSQPFYKNIQVNWHLLMLTVLAALAIGASACINTWDVFVVLPLMFLSLLVLVKKQKISLLSKFTFKMIIPIVVIIVCGAYILYLPFYSNFQAMVGGIGFTTQRTPVNLFLIVFSVFLFITLSFLIINLYEWRIKSITYSNLFLGSSTRIHLNEQFWILLIITASILTVCAFIGTGAIVLVLIFADLWLLFLSQDHRKQFMLVLLLMPLLIVLGTEIVYIRDFLDNSDWERMNTVFKFYVDVWILWGISSALAVQDIIDFWRHRLKDLLPSQDTAGFGNISSNSFEVIKEPTKTQNLKLPTWVSTVWGISLITLIIGSSIFLTEGTAARLSDRALWEQVSPPAVQANIPMTLDGTAFMRLWYPGDYEAIQWMNAHISGAPVVLEATSNDYQWNGRVSVYTGLPTVLGWGSHESQQRNPPGGPDAGIGQRASDVTTMYTTTDVNETLRLLHHYNVSYIYVGQLERQLYAGQSSAGLTKFDDMLGTSLSVVYSNREVTIYQVIG